MLSFKRLRKRYTSLKESFRGSKAETQRRRMEFEALERRLLLSADLGFCSPAIIQPADPLAQPLVPLVVFENQLPAATGQSADAQPVSPAVVDATADQAGAPTAQALPEAVPSDGPATPQGQPPAVAPPAAPADAQHDAAAAGQAPAGPAQIGATVDPAAVLPVATANAAVLPSTGLQVVFVDASVPQAEVLLAQLTVPMVVADTGPGAGSWNLPEGSPDGGGTSAGRDDGVLSIGNAGGDGAVLDPAVAVVPQADPATTVRYEVVYLDGQRDGIAQITDVLEQHQGIDAVHILSHGAAGTMRLGASLIDRDKLQDYAASLGQWQNALKAGGDILLYGCRIAEGETGVAFVEDLSRLTGADVAASADSTGSAGRGGNWSLEFTTGLIEAGTVFDPHLDPYGYLLDNISVSGTAGADTITVDFQSLTIT